VTAHLLQHGDGEATWILVKDAVRRTSADAGHSRSTGSHVSGFRGSMADTIGLWQPAAASRTCRSDPTQVYERIA
jgi:hypothetical protein